MRSTTRTTARHRRARSTRRTLLTVLVAYAAFLAAVALAVYAVGHAPTAEITPAAVSAPIVGHASPAADTPDTARLIPGDTVSDAMNDCLIDAGYEDPRLPVPGTVAAGCVATDSDIAVVETRP